MSAPGLVLTAAQPTGTTFPITITGTSFSGGKITITGAWLGGAGGAYIGLTFITSGYTGTSSGNNGPGGFVCTSSSAGSITLTDAGGFNGQSGTPVANLAVGAVVLYTGTITGGAANALVGNTYTIAGFDTTDNNGTYVTVASTATTLTLQNTVNSQTLDTHAGMANAQSISLVAPVGAAFLSMGIMDTLLEDNTGSFVTSVAMLESGGFGGYTGASGSPDTTLESRYPVGICCCGFEPDHDVHLTFTVYMACTFVPLVNDLSPNGLMKSYIGQLFPHGAQNTGGAPSGSLGQNFPY
jgi:hypothetical protein